MKLAVNDNDTESIGVLAFVNRARPAESEAGWLAEFLVLVPNGSEMHASIANVAEMALVELGPVVSIRPTRVSLSCHISADEPAAACNVADRAADTLRAALGEAAGWVQEPVLQRYEPLDAYLGSEATIINLR